jgi:thiol:disulfide interchange protein
MKRFNTLPLLLLFASSTLLAQSDVPFFKAHYNPNADPAADLQRAVAIARQSKRNILLDIGGEWCIWCHRLDSLFEQNPDLSEFLLKNYVPMKVNVGPKNENKEFLSQFPKIEGYPHLFVLDSNGKLIHSQDTGDLEEGKHHSPAKVMEFLKQWVPTKTVM